MPLRWLTPPQRMLLWRDCRYDGTESSRRHRESGRRASAGVRRQPRPGRTPRAWGEIRGRAGTSHCGAALGKHHRRCGAPVQMSTSGRCAAGWPMTRCSDRSWRLRVARCSRRRDTNGTDVPWWKGTKCFDWWRSRWRCRSCRHVFAVGLVLWPTRRAGNHPRGGGQPVDTVPSTAQAESLGLVYGLVRTQTRGWYDR